MAVYSALLQQKAAPLNRKKSKKTPKMMIAVWCGREQWKVVVAIVVVIVIMNVIKTVAKALHDCICISKYGIALLSIGLSVPPPVGPPGTSFVTSSVTSFGSVGEVNNASSCLME